MTPGRRVGALATAGILLLSACSATGPTAEETATPAGSTSAPDLDRDPHPGEALPGASTDGMWLPLALQDSRILDPGWGRDVRYADDTFLGLTDDGDRITYTAVDVHGEVLWQAERPSGSTGFEIRTDEQGHWLAALPDRAPDGTATVSGYDLASGEQVWGPTEPPGPGSRAGTPGAPTGQEEQAYEDPTTRTVITLADARLRAEDPGGAELWSLSVGEDTQVVGLAGGLLYLREEEAIRVHNVVTGAVAQAYDPEGEGRVVVPTMMVTQGATLLLDGGRTLIAPAPTAPPAPPSAP